MSPKIALYIALMILIMNLLTLPSVFSLDEGDRLIYEVRLDLSSGFREDQYDVEARVVVEATFTYLIKEIGSRSLVVEFESEVNFFDVDVITNHPQKNEMESMLRDYLREAIRQLETSSEEFAIQYRSLASQGLDLPITDLELPFSIPLNIEYSEVRAKLDKYKGRSALCLEAEFDYTDRDFIARGLIRDYSDLSSMFTLYAEVKLEIIPRSSYYYMSNFRLEMKFSVELKNQNVLDRSRMKSYEIRFKGFAGELRLAGEDLSVKEIRREGRELAIIVSGKGLGLIFIEIPREVDILYVEVDGEDAFYHEFESSTGSKYVVIFIPYSERTIRIGFSQEITGVEASKGLNEVILLAAMFAVLAVVVAVVLVIYFGAKKTTVTPVRSPQTPSVGPSI